MKKIVRKWFLLIIVIGLVFPLVFSFSCGMGDSCDKAREKCREKGGTPANCKEDSSSSCLYYEENCECDCMM